MESMTPDFLLQLVIALVAGASVYAGIRGDLVLAKMRAEQAVKDAEEANKRLDMHINDHLSGFRHGNGN